MTIDYFEKYGLYEKDFIIEAYSYNNHENKFKRGVQITVPKLELSVRSQHRKSFKQNQTRCLRMLDILLKSREELNI